MKTIPWRLRLAQGLRRLRLGNPHAAMLHLKQALQTCPVSKREELEHILYYLGMAIYRLGDRESAVRMWGVGCKVRRAGKSHRMYLRFSNGYGMAKQETESEDDWRAFYSIHLRRYLAKKRSKDLGTMAERDMINDLIRDHWLALEPHLDGRSTGEKLELFESVRIVFPHFRVVALDEAHDPIRVDFRSKSKVQAADPCPCGSGIEFSRCCGRTWEAKSPRFGQ
jgi:hypothetical protein